MPLLPGMALSSKAGRRQGREIAPAKKSAAFAGLQGAGDQGRYGSTRFFRQERVSGGMPGSESTRAGPEDATQRVRCLG